MSVRVALITGFAGQDGSYLADLLLSKDYYVWGMIRKTTVHFKTPNIAHLVGHPNLTLRYGDLQDATCTFHFLAEIRRTYPDLDRLEIYNLGAISHVKISFELPEQTGLVNGIGVLKILEAIRLSGYAEKIRFYQASTSELFGKVQKIPQNEETPFYPRSPYAVSKLFGFWSTKNYREAYGLHASNGILFNHESPRRDELFVTRKITKGLGAILKGELPYLTLGNLNSYRDWGHARDYVQGIWQMLQADEPDDYVLATNSTHTVREFVEKSFALKGFEIRWRGEGLNEVGYDHNTGRELIKVSEEFFRPAEVDALVGDSTKARLKFGWNPSTTFEELVMEMVLFDTATDTL